MAVKEAAPGALLLVTVLCCLHMWVRTLLPLTGGETKAAGDQMPYRNAGTFLTCGWLKAEAGSAGALSRRRNFSIPNRASYGGGGMEPGSPVLFLYVSWPWALGRLALSGGGGVSQDPTVGLLLPSSCSSRARGVLPSIPAPLQPLLRALPLPLPVA